MNTNTNTMKGSLNITTGNITNPMKSSIYRTSVIEKSKDNIIVNGNKQTVQNGVNLTQNYNIIEHPKHIESDSFNTYNRRLIEELEHELKE